MTCNTQVGEDGPTHQYESLSSNQEEADTRIILHAISASKNGAQTLVIQSPDTDVLVLLLHHRAAISAKNIYFATGHEGKHASLKRYIPVHTLYQLLKPSQHAIMLSVYCLTGCDSTSAFYGHGKASAFRIMMQYSEDYIGLEALGTRQAVTCMYRHLSMR